MSRDLTPDEESAVADFLADLTDMMNNTGKHQGHTLRQVGRCVYCTCGSRYQGSLPKKDRHE